MLLNGIVHIEQDDIAVLVGLVVLDDVDILFGREVLVVGGLQQHEILRLLGEFLVGEDAVLNEDLQIVPLLLVIGTHGGEQLLQTVGHLAGYVARDLFDVGVALQVAARHVERDVGRIDHAVQQRQIFGYYAVDLVGDEDLVAVKLYLVLLNLEIVVYLGEIEYSRQVERIVDVHVDVEQRIVA